jgi:hypothetical protein
MVKQMKPTETGIIRLVRFLTLVLAFTLVFATLNGCGDLTGDIATNIVPIVEFTNVPADQDTFSYAPVIRWKGRDPDGFVEEYFYADVVDSSALIDPVYYIPFISDEAWIRTEATSDTVYLLTETVQITELVFYLKCVDDRDAESNVIYRTFYRTNRAPRTPEIKWFTDPDAGYGHRIDVPDTLYSLNEISDIWPGLGFTWRSTDPDDRELYRIPLQFKYYLEKVPHDTVWEFVARDWVTRQDITFAGLPTGHYTFSVWARDDGYELSEEPAVANFDVYQPTFENTILLMNTTKEDTSSRARQGVGNILPGSQVGDLYRQLASRYPDVGYFHYAVGDSVLPFKSYLGRYRLVIWFSENLTRTTAPFEPLVRDYVRAGGRLWVLGAFVRKNMITNTTLDLMESTFAGNVSGVSVPNDEAEFRGALSGVRDLPDLRIDTSKTGTMYRGFWGPRYGTYPLLPGVDIMAAGSGVETAYYFNSFTDTASGDVFNDSAFVRAAVDTISFPPTPVGCLIVLNRGRVLEVLRVENKSRNAQARVQTLTNNVGSPPLTVVKVSYDYGEPWSVSDTIEVDYKFQPYSTFHLRPVGTRFEQLAFKPSGSIVVRYRVAVFTFPLYYLDDTNGDVTRMFNGMLDWFFYPFAH